MKSCSLKCQFDIKESCWETGSRDIILHLMNRGAVFAWGTMNCGENVSQRQSSEIVYQRPQLKCLWARSAACSIVACSQQRWKLSNHQRSNTKSSMHRNTNVTLRICWQHPYKYKWRSIFNVGVWMTIPLWWWTQRPLKVKMLIGHPNGLSHHPWSETDTVASACGQAAPLDGTCRLKDALWRVH